KLVLSRTLSIAGRVVGPDGAPMEAAHVTATPDFRGGAQVSPTEWMLGAAREEIADGAGRFEIRGVAPGRYELRASAGAPALGRERLGDAVSAEAGAHDVTLVIPRGGVLKGKLVLSDGKTPQMFTIALGGRTPI